MHRIASMHKTEYFASKHDKILIADMVLQRIKNGGSEPVRFLKRVDGELWVEVGDDEARQKVRHALRSTRTKKPERASAVTDQEIIASASLPVNQPLMQTSDTSPMVASSNITLEASLDLIRNKPESAPVLTNARSVNSTFLSAAALPWGPALGRHGVLSHMEASFMATGYPPAPTMRGIPFGMVGAHVSTPHFGVTPVCLLTDAQIMEALYQRRQGRAYGGRRGRPQFS